MNITPIEHKSKRVLTTTQLAQSFGTENRRISENFNRNNERFAEGKHFFNLSDNEKHEFLDRTQIADGSRNASSIYLWTEKGAWLHAKSLNTDKAWEAYEMLVDDYYMVKEVALHVRNLSPQLQYLVYLEQSQKELEKRVDTLTEGLTAVPDHTVVVERVNEYARWARIGHNEIYNKIYDILKAQHGIDVKQRVENERQKIDAEHHEKTGKHYASSTLKSKVNGIDVMVRMGVLDKFNSILVGLLSKIKNRHEIGD